MKKRVIVLSVFVVLSSALLASVPVLLCFLINSAIALNSDKVLIFIIAILSVLVSMMILKFLFNNLQYKYFNKEEVILKVRLFNGLNRGNIERLKTWPTSKFQQLFSTDIYNIIGIRIVTIPKLVKAISKIIFTLAAFLYMMIIHEVSFYVLIPVIILELILIPIGINYNKNALTHEKEYKDKLDFTDKYLAETGELITLIKGNSAYESSTEYYKKLNDDYLKVKNRTSSYLSLGRTTLYITSLIIFAVIVTLSAYLISLEYLTVGAMVFLILIVNNIHSSLLSPVPLLAQLNNYRTSMGRFIELENEKVKYNSLELKDFKAIVFDKVSFMYEGKTILNDVSFEIKQGEFVMLKGELGAGKTTIFNLMLGLVDPTIGSIYLDTVLMQIPLGKEERLLFSYVPRQNLLFSASILDNFYILTGINDEHKIREVLEMVYVSELIPNLNISAREINENIVKRLLIAMAILMDRKIILIDDFASKMEPEIAQKIFNNLKTLNKTVIYVSDNPLDENDRIIEI